MRAKRGYKEQKSKDSTGRWLKYYFEKKTCRNRHASKEDRTCFKASGFVAMGD